MRHTAAGLVLLVLVACGSPAAPPTPELLGPGPSVVFGPAHAPDGGQIVVGMLVPTPPSERLVDLVGEEAYAAFLEAESARPREAEADAPAAPEASVEVEEDEVVIDDHPFDHEAPDVTKAARLRAARLVLRRTGVRVVYRDLLASEVRGEPLVVDTGRDLHAAEVEPLQAYVAQGGRYYRDRLTVGDVGRARPGLGDVGRRGGGALANAITDAILTSDRVRRLPQDPLALVEAERDGDTVRVLLAETPAEASFRNLEDEVLEEVEPAADGTLAFRCPEPGPDAFTHRLVATWRGQGLELHRAFRVVDLVGAPECRVLATRKVVAGSTYAPRVVFVNDKTGAPVAGLEASLRLRRGDATLAEVTGRSGREGSLDVHLDVPADVEPGSARLHVGDESFYVRIVSGARLSVVTDRAVYRQSDEVHVRVLLHDGVHGRPLANRSVVLSLLRAEKRVRTSDHGIASATFRLRDARLGSTSVVAKAAGTSASSSLRVRAFELPTFDVTLDPPELELRPGESAPVTLTARYVNGEPMVGAKAWTYDLGRFSTRPERAVTDGAGRFEFVVHVVNDARSEHVVFYVDDVDGRRESATLPVTVLREEEEEEAAPEPEAQEDGQLVVRPTRRVCKVGDVLDLELEGADGPTWIDVSRGPTVVRAFSATLVDGRARVSVPLDAGLAGHLHVRAWRFAPGRGLQPFGARSSVLVVRGRSLKVRAEVEEDLYRPGETAHVGVTIRDARGEPTAAVLGYWGVDEALLTIAPLPDGREDVFDLLPGRPGTALTAVARAAERGESLEAGTADGSMPAPKTRTSFRWFYDIVERDRPDRDRLYSRQVHTVARKGLGAARVAFVESCLRAPLGAFRTAEELREVVVLLVRGGWLDPLDLLDPWGTPFAIGQGLQDWREPSGRWSWWYRSGTPVRSSGPDREPGTSDDVHVVWEPHGVHEFQGRLGRFLALVRGRAETEDALLAVTKLWGPAGNGLIGLGGGAGGAFGGRGGRRDLGGGGGGKRAGGYRPVVRKDFAPTLCFVPEAIVGPEGVARLAIPLKDSITTWRMRLVASAADGATGIGTSRIRVSQPLHVNPWVAPHLTVGDELDLPVALHDETDEPMDVLLKLDLTDHVECVGPASVVVHVEPGRTAAHNFRIRALRPGGGRVRVEATSGEHADVVERVVHIRPDGREVVDVASATLGADAPWTAGLPALAENARDTAHRVRVYPTPLSEAVAGFEGLIGEPHGCFEQTSSTVYPMVLALDVMQRTNSIDPELADRARRYVDDGYRRLCGYEVRAEPGGFSLWGKKPANLFLSAYALHEFSDMRRVYEVDPALVERIVAYLQGKQQQDGAWPSSSRPYGPVSTEEEEVRARFPLTAYVAWALARAGEPSQAAMAWLETHRLLVRDPYALALAALAFQGPGGDGAVAHELVETFVEARSADAHGVLWRAAGRTGVGGRGRSADVEATALVVQALLADGEHEQLAWRGLDRLVKWRDAKGRFGTTQSTVLALMALLAADPSGPREGDVRVLARGGAPDAPPVFDLTLPAGSTEPGRLELAALPASGPLTVAMSGAGRIRVAVSRHAWVPWEHVAAPEGRLALAVSYPEGTVPVGQPALATVWVRNRSEYRAENVTLEVGLPPGCTAKPDLVRGKGSKRVERGETEMVIYLGHVEPDAELSFDVPFTPRYDLDVVTPPSRAYEYYVPEEAVQVGARRVRAVR